MFDLAEWWKDYGLFDKIILDYDTLTPNNTLACQVVVVVPQMNATFTNLGFALQVQTNYNGVKQTDELTEIVKQ